MGSKRRRSEGNRRTQLEPLPGAPVDFVWPGFPEAERFIEDHIREFLAHHGFARSLAADMTARTSTRFFDWVDHLEVPPRLVDTKRWEVAYGFVGENVETPAGEAAFWNPQSNLVRLRTSAGARQVNVAIRVDSIQDFQVAHGLCLPVKGAPFGAYRVARIAEGERALGVVERRAYRGYVPQERANPLAYWRLFEGWSLRRRRFDDIGQGLAETLRLARQLAKRVGEDLAAHIVFEAERRYWQSRNAAARYQKWRQDVLGLGWANHDHHTLRSSREVFGALIEVLAVLGFRRRERYQAGAEAGWGAQILEQPVAGLVVFADVDLAPGEVTADFPAEPLPPAARHGTIGLWCALHGESILEAGLHHLAARFEFDHLTESLREAGIEMMKPFSDFPFLRQAFTRGETWAVSPKCLEAVRASGAVSDEGYDRFRREGAIGSHLENLQRREGHKGFNQESVNAIIRRTNPDRPGDEA